MANFPTEQDDVIFGDDNADIISGLGGNDVLFGNGGSDWLLGGDGDDLISAGPGVDAIDGGKGRDTVSYAAYGGKVWVSLEQSVGYIEGGAAGDTDHLTNIENVTGGAHDDNIWGNGKANTLRGNNGSDRLLGLGGADKLYGGDGNDYIEGGAGADIMEGGGNGSTDTLLYTESAAGVAVNLGTGEAKSGDAEGDVFTGFEGVQGSKFADTLTGDGFDNFFSGNDGADTILGGGGSDYLFGHEGKDDLRGGDGDDQIRGGAGGDVVNGGKGIDYAFFDKAEEGVTLSLATGAGTGGEAKGDTYFGIEKVAGSQFGDTISGGGAGDGIFGYLGDDVLNGGGGDDVLAGEEGNDTVTGGNGNDTLFGDGFDPNSGAGSADILSGGKGEDSLHGGLGGDTLTGGGEHDTFWFATITSSTAQLTDTITDFTVGLDSIAVEFDLDQTTAAHDNDALFIGANSFAAGNAGQVRITQGIGSTIVEIETTGDTSADFVLKVTGPVALTASDFAFF